MDAEHQAGRWPGVGVGLPATTGHRASQRAHHGRVRRQGDRRDGPRDPLLGDEPSTHLLHSARGRGPRVPLGIGPHDLLRVEGHCPLPLGALRRAHGERRRVVLPRAERPRTQRSRATSPSTRSGWTSALSTARSSGRRAGRSTAGGSPTRSSGRSRARRLRRTAAGPDKRRSRDTAGSHVARDRRHERHRARDRAPAGRSGIARARARPLAGERERRGRGRPSPR